MNRLASSLALLGALGASAHPSGGHAHLHGRHSHHVEQRNIGDVITAVINGVTVSWVQTEDYYHPAAATTAAVQVAAAPVVTTVPATTTTPAPAVSVPVSVSVPAVSVAAAAVASVASVASGTGATTFTSFAQHCASAKKMKRATNVQIAYKGNVGSTYGCNIMLLASSQVASNYDNTVRFHGGSQDMNCYVWNKIGPDGGIDGFWGNGATTFKLAAGAEQYVAVDANSQGGAACYPGTSASKTSWGQLAGTWLEFDFENSSNNGWSGADASCIVAQTAGLAVPGLSVCSGSDCSKVSPGGAVDNAYDASLVDADGVGLKASGPMKLEVNVGFSG